MPWYPSFEDPRNCSKSHIEAVNWLASQNTTSTACEYVLKRSVDAGLSIKPISGPVVASLLRLLVTVRQPTKILEIGTYTGYSLAAIAEAATEDATILAFERSADLFEFTSSNLSGFDFFERIELRNQDFLNFPCESHQGSFDLVFVDCDKKQYPEIIENSIAMLRPDGVMVIDNIAFRDDQSCAQHVNWEPSTSKSIALLHESNFQSTSFLAIRDGVFIGVGPRSEGSVANAERI